MSDLACRLAAIHIHPIKSCAGIAVDEALLVETGLELDRAWMLVDPEGRMVTQRVLPRLALVQPTLGSEEMRLRAPGMLALHVALDRVETPTRARVWDDEVKAYDMGELAAQWFSDFAGRRLRLVRFDPEQRRLSDRRWSGAVEAENAFSDAFPLLVVGQASLDDLNRRLGERGQAAVGIERFRPNLVLDGIDPYDEDQIDTLTIAAEGAEVK
ncbi:MAG: MOSC N-terminal beta barrel domain-containing protein, partial [Burkholderiales bacterium]|nr:MOSC N-terminal beta barrel domain-containing protein [Burkholderiales bacterium]